MATLESMSGMEAASQISRLGRAGTLALGQSHGAWCLGWMQNRGVVPRAGQEQHGEARKHIWVPTLQLCPLATPWGSGHLTFKTGWGTWLHL